MNPESLDSSIQSALSALFPPFEVTAPIVLCQLFRTIEERYHGDALRCLLDFLIPSKHLLESVQQAACAGYSDVVFRCEGWPLCLHDKTVVQLAPVNPLLLRPGDFYLQVEPFGDQAARIVLKSLLEEGRREVEETPIPETSYPCIFTEDWVREVNEGRHGTPLSRCLLCTEQGVIKLPWADIAIPEFLEKPKLTSMYQEAPPEAKRQTAVPSHFNSSTLPLETMILPSNMRTSASLRPVDCSSKPSKMEKRMPRLFSKPVGWVSPNTWDSRINPETEGDYVDLVDVAKGKECAEERGGRLSPPTSVLFRPVRPPPPVPLGSSVFCERTLQYEEEPGTPCGQKKVEGEPTEQDKCRYRDSYLAALRNPVSFEKGSVDLLAALEEAGLCEDLGLRPKGPFEGQSHKDGPVCNFCTEPRTGQEPREYRRCSREPTSDTFASDLKRAPANYDSESVMKEPPIVLKAAPGLNHSHKVQTKLISQQLGHNLRGVLSGTSGEKEVKAQQSADIAKPSGKHKIKARSLSAVSETPKGSPFFCKPSSRSHSDICPETISSMMQSKGDQPSARITPKPERWKPPKKDSQSCESEIPSAADRPDARFQSTKTSSPLSPAHADAPRPPRAQESGIENIGGLLELGVICLPGSRDKTGRALVEVHCDRKEWASPLVSAENLCELLLYLHSIPRKDVRELGMTLVVNARKKPPPQNLYRALLMAQEQALHAVHSIVVLTEKDACLRAEKHPGLQMDTVTSMKALFKTAEASQLTSDFGGSFPYSHADWLQFQQKLVSFMTDLEGADKLLQRAIKKVNESKILDTVQEVQLCIREQRASMKEVLEDSRLVTLQREGGAALARMRREEFRFPQSEDFRAALESVTSLYNQVEEKLHTLVMKSNESLQQLEFLFKVKETESKLGEAGTWFTSEGEETLKDICPTEDTLICVEKVCQRIDLLLAQSKEKQQRVSTLVTEAERITGGGGGGGGGGVSSPVADTLWTMVNAIKCNTESFMSRAEQRRKDLDTLAQVYRFCDQASTLAQECSQLLEQVEPGCDLAQAGRSSLQMYEEKLGGEFSTQHFHAFKSKAGAVKLGGSGAMKTWNAARVRCQEARRRLEEMRLKNKRLDKNQTAEAAHPQEQTAETGKRRVGSGEAVCSLTDPGQVVYITENTSKYSSAECLNPPSKPVCGEKGEYPSPPSPEAAAENGIRPTNGRGHREVEWKLREHQSEADLTSRSHEFPEHKPLGRSLSEGSCARSANLMFASALGPRQNPFQPPEPNRQPVQNPSARSDSESRRERDEEDACSAKRCASSHAQSPQDLTLLTPEEDSGGNVVKLGRIMEELLFTEKEYVKALGYVREHYFPELDRADVPQDLRGQKGGVFGNLEKLHDFHCHHFLEELESCLKEPFRVGRCFLRHKESFALYALYSKNKPQSDALLLHHGQTFFKQKQLRLGDKMDLWSYLLKPVQRISKYGLLLQDMMRECGPAQARELTEVKAALEVVQFQLRHGNNLLAMDAIHQCDVNLKEQGQLIRQDEFLVTFRKKKCSRHIFLFQELILFSKTRKTDVGNETYIYKQSFKTSDIGMTQNSGESGLCFEIWFRKRKTQDTYTLQAASREAKEAWTRDLERILWEQAVHNREVRMQERVFMGLGNKPFKDIQPSDAAIHDRAVNYVVTGRENKVPPSVGSPGAQEGLQGAQKTPGGSAGSPEGCVGQPKPRGIAGGLDGYVSPSGVLEEDEVDRESVIQNLLLDSSESSGESVSGFSSSSHSFHSALEREVEDASSVCASVITGREAATAIRTEVPAASQKPTAPLGSPEKSQAAVAAKSKPEAPSKDLPSGKNTVLGKSTDV